MKFIPNLWITCGWLLDVFSTYIGIQLGYKESSQLFSMFPFMWLLVLNMMACLIYYFKWAPKIIRGALLLALVLYSFVPSIANTLLILGGT